MDRNWVLLFINVIHNSFYNSYFHGEDIYCFYNTGIIYILWMVIKWQRYRINPQLVKQRSSNRISKTLTLLWIYMSISFSLRWAFFQVVNCCQQFGQPEHVSSAEDHIKLWAVQLCSSLRHLRSLAETRLLQKKLTWREGEDREGQFRTFYPCWWSVGLLVSPPLWSRLLNRPDSHRSFTMDNDVFTVPWPFVPWLPQAW